MHIGALDLPFMRIATPTPKSVHDANAYAIGYCLPIIIREAHASCIGGGRKGVGWDAAVGGGGGWGWGGGKAITPLISSLVLVQYRLCKH